jgi:hypothetical protein
MLPGIKVSNLQKNKKQNKIPMVSKKAGDGIRVYQMNSNDKSG